MSWAETDEEALANAMTEWPNGGMKFPKQDIKSPLDFEQMAKLVRPEDFEGRMLISSDLEAHRKEIQKFANMGFDRHLPAQRRAQPEGMDRGVRARGAPRHQGLDASALKAEVRPSSDE